MKKNLDTALLRPSWRAPLKVHSLVTLTGWPEHNLSYRGDDPGVANSRLALEEYIGKGPLRWPKAAHGKECVKLPSESLDGYDALYTLTRDTVCILTMADCLPILLTNKAGSCVSVLHGGWRSLEAGVIENTIGILGVEPDDLLVWLGPAISGSYYEVGEDLIEQFGQDNYRLQNAVLEKQNGKFLLDLYQIARNIISKLGIPFESISGGELCAYADHRFHSVRRSGTEAGRFAVAIWFE